MYGKDCIATTVLKASCCWTWFATTVLQERGSALQRRHLGMSSIRTGASGFIKNDTTTSFICFAATGNLQASSILLIVFVST
jgi:hypothetical protein